MEPVIYHPPIFAKAEGNRFMKGLKQMPQLLQTTLRKFRRKNKVIYSSKDDAKNIKINFSDFWSTFDIEDNYLTRLLKTQYTLEISDEPDFLIYSVFGNTHKKFSCTKIFYTGENVRPNFDECDYAFSFDFLDDPKHFRLPLYAWWAPPEELVKPIDLNARKILSQKNRFCNFIYGNPKATKRIEFMQKLSKYKQVDCAGTLLNNVGKVITEKEKVDFIKDYKFTIAFENCEYPGYTTEKLVQPMLVNSLPIYCGNSLIDRDFNTNSFLSYHDFPSEEALIERIIEIDKNDELYIHYLEEPFYHNNQINEFVDPRKILGQFEFIFENEKPSQ
jgi:hypothetical protein